MAWNLELVRPWNTHWEGGEVSPLVLRHPQHRVPVPHWVEEVQDPPGDQWLLVAGPRQIGKTTSLGHVARRLVNRGVDPQRVVVVPLDQPSIIDPLDVGLGEMIEEIRTHRAPTPDAPVFLLLDEVQELPDWARELKAAHDRFHREFRVLATGSSAMRIINPADADFPGRINVRTMHPMKFREVVEAHPELPEHAGDWEAVEARARAARDAVGDPEADTGAALEALHAAVTVGTLDAFLTKLAREVALWGGYPQARPGAEGDLVQRRNLFDQTWNAVLAKDVPHVGVQKTREFERLFHHIARNPGGKFVPHNVGNRIDVKAQTVRKWKRVLEDALLVQQLAPFKPSLEPGRGKDKAYLVDPGWYAYVTATSDPERVGDDIGLLVENVLVDHARRLQFNLTHTTNRPLGYVDAPEVDVAMDVGSRWVLLESKYRSTVGTHLAEVARDREDVLRVVVTRNHFERPREPDGVWFVPLHEWLLVC